MSAANNGGAAFPELETSFVDRDGITQYNSASGMTLRDYFAAKAPISVEDAMRACRVDAHSIGMLPTAQRIVVLTALAVMRGEYADAMLAERAQ